MKIALFVIYNHRYDKNIPLLDNIYKNRFSNIYHIVPFYDGLAQNVISVYDSSFQFQGYIAQAYQHIKDKGFTHVFVVADDMVINPCITETNLHSITGLYLSYSGCPYKRDDSIVEKRVGTRRILFHW